MTFSWPTIFWLQATNPSSIESQDGFFDSTIWIIAIVPLLAAFCVGWYNKKSKQTIQEFTDDDFQDEVMSATGPVLVHCYREWSIGDQCMVQQVEKLASRQRPYKIGFLDIEKNPESVKFFVGMEFPGLALMIKGERVFQSKGVFNEADIHYEVLDLIERQGRLVESQNEAPVAGS